MRFIQYVICVVVTRYSKARRTLGAQLGSQGAEMPKGGFWTKKVKTIRRTEALIVGARDVDSTDATGLPLPQHSYYVYGRRLRSLCCLAATKWADGSMRGTTWLSASRPNSRKISLLEAPWKKNTSHKLLEGLSESRRWGVIYGKALEQSTARLKAGWYSI